MSPYHWGFYYAALCKQAANVAPPQSSQDQQYRRNIGTALTGLGALSTLGSGVAGGMAIRSQYAEDAPWRIQYQNELDALSADKQKVDWSKMTVEQADEFIDKLEEQRNAVKKSRGSRLRSAIGHSLRVPALAGVGSLGLLGTGLYLRSTS